jgi:tetratricopeptide (TPR) repeat protein
LIEAPAAIVSTIAGRKPLDEPRNRVQDPFMRLVSFFTARHPSKTSRLGSPKLAPAIALAIAAALLASPVQALSPDLPPAEPPAVPERPDIDPPTGRPSSRSLDFYFAALAAARDDASAKRARDRITAHWKDAGSDTAALLSARATQAGIFGDLALALDLVDAAIVVAPHWPNGRFHRAAIHLARHDIDRSLADLSATLIMEPRHLDAMAAIAAILETADRKPEALKWLRHLARLDPRNPAVAADRMERLTTEVEGREL